MTAHRFSCPLIAGSTDKRSKSKLEKQVEREDKRAVKKGNLIATTPFSVDTIMADL